MVIHCTLTFVAFVASPFQPLLPGQVFTARTLMQDISLEVILNVVFGLHEGERFCQLKESIVAMMNGFKSPLTSGSLFFPALQKDLGAWSPWGSFLRKQQQFNLAVKQYRLVPNLDEMRYHLYLELLEERSDHWIQHTLIPAMDWAISQVNLEYAQNRDSGRLHSLCLHLMCPGWAEALQRQAIAGGQRDVQYKWKVFSPEAQPVDYSRILKTFESLGAGMDL